MGRPKKDDDKKVSERVYTCLTPPELKKLQDYAESENISTSRLINNMIRQLISTLD